MKRRLKLDPIQASPKGPEKHAETRLWLVVFEMGRPVEYLVMIMIFDNKKPRGQSDPVAHREVPQRRLLVCNRDRLLFLLLAAQGLSRDFAHIIIVIGRGIGQMPLAL